jgi:release factor glutamine methyltransferase
MLTYAQAFQQLYKALQQTYDQQEAAAIAHRYMADLSGLSYTQRLMRKEEPMPDEHAVRLAKDESLLVSGKPLQQVLGYEWFMGRKFVVNEYVLIPRPETEELVHWIIDDHKQNPSASILDIGTGSGCIPISLKLGLIAPDVTGCDISEEALTIATENARTLNADITLKQIDFLQRDEWQTLGVYDIIVSNPPYIPVAESDTLHANVREHEPHLALFVPDSDPLLFYKEIALFGKSHLQTKGIIYCELHIDYAEQTKEMFEGEGYTNVEIRKDIHGNPRVLKAKLA